MAKMTPNMVIKERKMRRRTLPQLTEKAMLQGAAFCSGIFSSEVFSASIMPPFRD